MKTRTAAVKTVDQTLVGSAMPAVVDRATSRPVGRLLIRRLVGHRNGQVLVVRRLVGQARVIRDGPHRQVGSRVHRVRRAPRRDMMASAPSVDPPPAATPRGHLTREAVGPYIPVETWRVAVRMRRGIEAEVRTAPRAMPRVAGVPTAEVRCVRVPRIGLRHDRNAAQTLRVDRTAVRAAAGKCLAATVRLGGDLPRRTAGVAAKTG